MATARTYPPKLFVEKWDKYSGPLPDGPYADDNELVYTCRVQERALMDFAMTCPFPSERLAQLRRGRAAGGAEHEVFVPVRGRVGSRVWKITRRDRWGLRRATPLEYLRRLERFDMVSQTRVRVAGIAVDNGMPLLVTSMDFILGSHPPDLHDRLLQLGWETIVDPDQMLSYHHAEDGIVMRDAHPKNFILTPKGSLVPIDVIFR
jgi:hypothetical protein